LIAQITQEHKMEIKCVLLIHASHTRSLLLREPVLDVHQTQLQTPTKEVATGQFHNVMRDKESVLTRLFALTVRVTREHNIQTQFVRQTNATQIKLFQFLVLALLAHLEQFQVMMEDTAIQKPHVVQDREKTEINVLTVKPTQELKMKTHSALQMHAPKIRL